MAGILAWNIVLFYIGLFFTEPLYLHTPFPFLPQILWGIEVKDLWRWLQYPNLAVLKPFNHNFGSMPGVIVQACNPPGWCFRIISQYIHMIFSFFMMPSVQWSALVLPTGLCPPPLCFKIGTVFSGSFSLNVNCWPNHHFLFHCVSGFLLPLWAWGWIFLMAFQFGFSLRWNNLWI